MLRPSILTASIALVLLASAAQAQGLTKLWRDQTPLTAQDRDAILGAVQQIHGRPPGTAATWSNAPEGHTGTVTLLDKSTRQNMPCERIQYDIREPQSTRQQGFYVLTSCQLPDGTWKLAE
jgi:hypothetical protein